MEEYVLNFPLNYREKNTHLIRKHEIKHGINYNGSIFFSWMVFVLRDVDNVHCEFRQEFNCSLIISR